MTTLPPYRGFQAAVEYDDGMLFLRILHIEDSVSTTCDAASEVISAFKELVDDYIATCEELGEKPNRPFKGSFNVRMEPTLHHDAAMTAAANETTLNSWVVQAIREKLERDRENAIYLIASNSRYYDEHSKAEKHRWVLEPPAEITDLNKYREFMLKKRGGRL